LVLGIKTCQIYRMVVQCHDCQTVDGCQAVIEIEVFTANSDGKREPYDNGITVHYRRGSGSEHIGMVNMIRLMIIAATEYRDLEPILNLFSIIANRR